MMTKMKPHLLIRELKKWIISFLSNFVAEIVGFPTVNHTLSSLSINDPTADIISTSQHFYIDYIIPDLIVTYT